MSLWSEKESHKLWSDYGELWSDKNDYIHIKKVTRLRIGIDS